MKHIDLKSLIIGALLTPTILLGLYGCGSMAQLNHNLHHMDLETRLRKVEAKVGIKSPQAPLRYPPNFNKDGTQQVP